MHKQSFVFDSAKFKQKKLSTSNAILYTIKLLLSFSPKDMTNAIHVPLQSHDKRKKLFGKCFTIFDVGV